MPTSTTPVEALEPSDVLGLPAFAFLTPRSAFGPRPTPDRKDGMEGSSTDPRTEMRWKVDYTTGDRMWDADVYLPSGTDGASFVQILRSVHPSGTPATDIMLNAYNTSGGTVRRYDGTVLKTGAYDTWFNVKIAHEASTGTGTGTGTGTIKVYFDDSLVLTVDDRGPATRYFKNGVYNHGSGRAEARFRNILYWTR